MQTLYEQNTTDIVLLPLIQTQLPEQVEARQHATLPQTTGKHSARKGRHLLRRIEVLLLKTSGFGLLSVGLLCGVLVTLFVCLMMGFSVWEYFYPNHDSQYNLPWWMVALNVLKGAVPVLLGACLCGITGKTMNKRAVHRDTLPLTRVNTADLPAPDSLVRASQEPTQAQQTVLLRATTQNTALPAEQLLRASGKHGQE